jgi:hypothetical protein
MFMERGSFNDAEGTLRQAASSCTNGETGRRALIMLAALRLDPRNPAQSADSAALMAIRYLALPDGNPADRPLAISLYALALDHGANPLIRPTFPGPPGSIAPRFADCGAPPPSNAPELPGLTSGGKADAMHAVSTERDSLAAQVGRLTETNRTLEKKVQELEAELQRVRRLLGGTPGRPPEKDDAGPPNLR